jgi:LPXTG-site transpeptidase (sortase) family protein
MRTEKRLSYWIGTGMMVVAVMGLVWTFYPIVAEEIRYRLGTEQAVIEPINSGYILSIPSIRIRAQVIAGVDPFKPKVYLAALQHGVAQASGSALPGQTGTQFLFAHSSEAPWRMTRDNTAFYRLNRVKPGDEIMVSYQGMVYHYRVKELKYVWPNEVNYLVNNRTNQLILQTCTPIGTDWKRLLVIADDVH